MAGLSSSSTGGAVAKAPGDSRQGIISSAAAASAFKPLGTDHTLFSMPTKPNKTKPVVRPLPGAGGDPRKGGQVAAATVLSLATHRPSDVHVPSASAAHPPAKIPHLVSSSIGATSAKPSSAAGTGSRAESGSGKPRSKKTSSRTKEHKEKGSSAKKKKKSTSVEGPTMADVLKKKGKKKKEKPSKDQGKTSKEKAISGSNPNRKLPTAASKRKKDRVSSTASASSSGAPPKHPPPSTPSSSSSAPAGYSAQQTAVNDMMRRALEEDKYSALGSMVDTDSDSDGDGRGSTGEGAAAIRWNHRPQRGVGGPGALDQAKSLADTIAAPKKLDRSSILNAMRRHLRVEGMRSVRNFDGGQFLDEAEEYAERHGHDRPRSLAPMLPNGSGEEGFAEETPAADERRSGKRRKKNRGKSSSSHAQLQQQQHSGASPTPETQGGGSSSDDTPMSESGEDEWEEDAATGGGVEPSSGAATAGDDNTEYRGKEEESSIFGQTTGASNATWVECDRCKKWRRLRGVVDARKLPSRWYCSMNKTDPDHARCSAPEEEYESATTPESAMDQRARKHFRVWVRRLHGYEAFEHRQRGNKKRCVASAGGAVGPYEWIRCCNPSCGKWRMLLRSMDAGSVIDKCPNGEWYCVMNTWDEKSASCGAAQENLPSLGCPPWVMVDDED